MTGDAVCSFNPVYGQGMTVAAMQALALRRHIGAGTRSTASRFFKDIAKVIDIPWDIAVGADLAFPQVPGPRPADGEPGEANVHATWRLALAERAARQGAHGR
ncbi:MAG TPA: hypothetical protein VIY52_05455 [Streptosporangiaceae bacterium]